MFSVTIWRHINTLTTFCQRKLIAINLWTNVYSLRPWHKYKASVNVMIKNVSWSCNLHNRKHPEKMEIFILFAGFITVASPGYKSWIQFERNYSHSVLNFNFYAKTIRWQMYFQGLKLDFNSTRWMPNLVSLDVQSYAALKSETETTYLTNRMLHYKH